MKDMKLNHKVDQSELPSVTPVLALQTSAMGLNVFKNSGGGHCFTELK